MEIKVADYDDTYVNCSIFHKKFWLVFRQVFPWLSVAVTDHLASVTTDFFLYIINHSGGPDYHLQPLFKETFVSFRYI